MRLPFASAMHRSILHRAVTSLFSHEGRLLASSICRPISTSSLPIGGDRPTLFKRRTGSEAVDLLQYRPTEIINRLPTFTDKDWSEYLGIVAHYRIARGRLLPFTSEQMKHVEEIKKRLLEWLGEKKDKIESTDYFNLLRSLDVFSEFGRLTKRRTKTLGLQQSLPSSVHENIFHWFMKNYEKLDRHAFFQILNRKVVHATLNDILSLESQEDVLKVLEHGTKLAEDDAEIVNILHLLYTIELYSGSYSDPRFSKSSQRLLATLANKALPVDGFDLFHSLQFVSSQKTTGSALSQRAVFRRHADNRPAWNWLRNSIELVFANDDYEDMRPIAAVAAVRAYKWKAIDYSPDDVNKYLTLAAKPYLTDPAIFFKPSRNDAFNAKRTALSYLVLAIRSAAISDLPDLGKLSVRLDDAYWSKFFDVVEKEAPKLERTALLNDLKRLKIYKPLSKQELRFLSDPLGQGRDDRLKSLLKQKYPQTPSSDDKEQSQ
uniref:ATPase expression protein 2, mitochondrial n=1 Tax=Plectus sambesii TaxID=2011161 RepID=A0A914XCA5_9BILA